MLSSNQRTSKLVLHEAPKYAPPKLKILCATDLSPRSEAAVARALRLAHTLGADCMLLHVVSDDVALRLAGRRAERAHSALHWQARHFASLRVEPEISVRVGDPYQTIARAAQAWDPHLIVLGRQRRRPVTRARRTSAEWLSHRVGRPVLIVNSFAERQYSSVMFAGAQNIGPYVRLIDQLAMLDAAHISVVPPLRYADRVALFISRALDSNSKLLSVLQRRIHRGTQRWIEEAGLHLMGFEIVSRPTKPRGLLARLTQKATPQLLVVPMTRTGMFGRGLANTSAAIALRTNACDVLLASEESARAALLSPDLLGSADPEEAQIKEVAIA
jgi:nucleotide-binding universal stress UspA family protein